MVLEITMKKMRKTSSVPMSWLEITMRRMRKTAVTMSESRSWAWSGSLSWSTDWYWSRR